MSPRSCSSVSGCSTCYIRSLERTNANYRRIKLGLRKSNPAAIVLWAFHKIPSRGGLTSRRVITYLKQYFKLSKDPRRTGKALGNMLKHAVEFGLLKRQGKKYFLAEKNP